ncbi:MAG TPA: hypothetical protein VNH64_12785, partial [Parvularculaceae bacterium]|nr:hypothetical protein [Parvularculaceae bacterium]
YRMFQAPMTVGAELKELYSAVEEGKADVMGAWNILYMMQRGELPAAEKNNFLATYFVDIFRSMRFGTNDAHGRGAAFQYHYIVKNGGAVWDADAKRYRLDFAKFEQAIKNLTHDVVVVEGNGDYDAANKFLDDDAVTDANALAVIATLSDIPVDIAPHYKDKI